MRSQLLLLETFLCFTCYPNKPPCLQNRLNSLPVIISTIFLFVIAFKPEQAVQPSIMQRYVPVTRRAFCTENYLDALSEYMLTVFENTSKCLHIAVMCRF